ncbi:MAG: hypothetical protein WCA09_04615 [Burkholderiales bacterium]
MGPNYAFAPGSTFYQASTDSGILTFNGDGTASSLGTSRTMNLSAGAGSLVTVSAFTSDISYSVNDDGTVDILYPSTQFTVVFPAFNVNGTVTGQTTRLQMGRGKSMLVTAPSQDYSVETLTYTTGQPTQYRICTRSSTATKISAE